MGLGPEMNLMIMIGYLGVENTLHRAVSLRQHGALSVKVTHTDVVA